MKQQKKSLDREVLCPICFLNVPSHFCRHIARHHATHPDVIDILKLPPRDKNRRNLIQNLRKQGFFHARVEKKIFNPVRRSINAETEYAICRFCLGHYSKKLLYRHVKKCQKKLEDAKDIGKYCLPQSQTFMACAEMKNDRFFKKMRVYEEVFDIITADKIGMAAKSDSLIILFGEAQLNRHKRKNIATLVSNKMRELARLKIVIQESYIKNFTSIFEILKPEHFDTIVNATRFISGYDISKKSFKAPSLALHMKKNLTFACDIALKLIM